MRAHNLELSPESVRAAEKTLPRLGWITLSLSLLVNIAVILTAYEIPLSHRSATLAITYVAVFGAFSGYVSGLILVDVPSLVKTGTIKWRLAHLLRNVLIALCCGSGLGMAIFLGWYVTLIAGSPPAGPQQIHFTFFATAYSAAAMASAALTTVNALRFVKILDLSRHKEFSDEATSTRPESSKAVLATASPTRE